MQDIIEIFHHKYISDMSDEELKKCLEKLREFRLQKFTKASTKKQTVLDKILKTLDVEKSHMIVQKMQEKAKL